MNFLADSSKVFPFRHNQLFQLKRSVSKIFVLIAMNDTGLTHFSGYYTELCLKQEQKVVDEPDFANISQCNIDRLVFEENNQERPPFSLHFCCGDNIKFDRSLLVIVIHSQVIFFLVIFCIIFITISDRQQICIRHNSAFLSLPGPYFTDAKAMIKRINTQPHCFVSVVGPAVSGKTRLIGRLSIKRKSFYPALTTLSTFISIISNIMTPFQWTVNSNMLISDSFTD